MPCPAAISYPQDVAEDQLLLAKLVHSLRAEGGDTDAQYEMLAAAQVGDCDCVGMCVYACAHSTLWAVPCMRMFVHLRLPG